MKCKKEVEKLKNAQWKIGINTYVGMVCKSCEKSIKA